MVLSLAGLSFQIARRSTKATDLALQMARQVGGADRASTVPFDSLSGMLTADTVTSGTVTIITNYAVTSPSSARKNVYVITSTSIPGTSPDTILIQRARPSPIPLK